MELFLINVKNGELSVRDNAALSDWSLNVDFLSLSNLSRGIISL